MRTFIVTTSYGKDDFHHKLIASILKTTAQLFFAGVIATTKIAKGTIIEEAHCIEVGRDEYQSSVR